MSLISFSSPEQKFLVACHLEGNSRVMEQQMQMSILQILCAFGNRIIESNDELNIFVCSLSRLSTLTDTFKDTPEQHIQTFPC